jgi:hypothetical protein
MDGPLKPRQLRDNPTTPFPYNPDNLRFKTMAENHAILNAKAFAEYVSTMYRAYKALETGAESVDANGETFTDLDEIRDRAAERALSVEVRSDWQLWPPAVSCALTHYRILLTTGGPALRLEGELSAWCDGVNGAPKTAKIQWLDWGIPWSDYEPETNLDDALIWFAALFFGA